MRDKLYNHLASMKSHFKTLFFSSTPCRH